jgi:hypothetical protein
MKNETIATFIHDHWPVCRKWEDGKLLAWVGWHNSNGFICCTLRDDDTIAGLVIARPMMEPADFENWYEFDQEGSCIYIDLCIALSRLALKGLGIAVLKRFGMRETIAWRVPPYNVLHWHSSAKFRRNLLRKEVAYG